jgi:uncharacterized protein YhdP
MLNISYKGPVARNKNTNSFVNGVIAVSNGNVTYVPRGVELKNVNSRIVFKSSDVYVEKLEGTVLNNKIVMQGVAKNLLTVVSTEANKAVVEWNIYSPSLNLASFAYLLRQPKKATVARKRTGTNFEKTAEQIDEVVANGSIKVNLKADKLVYKKFEGSNATANLTLLNDRYILHNVSLTHAGGTMDINGFVLHSAEHYNNANVNVSLKNVDVNRVFEAFSNFGQDGITADNLRGKLTSDVSMNVTMDEDGQVYKESVQGVVDFSLKNGALLNYEPMKKMQVFILKNRDFNNIKFAELKNRSTSKTRKSRSTGWKSNPVY